MTYKLNTSIELSKDLSRYARKCGQDDNPKWELGHCTVEFLKEEGSFYIAEPTRLDASEIERITIDSETNLKGDFGLQFKRFTTSKLFTEQEKDEFLSDNPIDVPEGSTLEATISKELTAKQQPLNKESADFAVTRLETTANTPKADKLTVRAIIAHCGVRKVREQQNQHIDDLANLAGISRNEAIWLVNCRNDDGIAFEEGCWCTKNAKFLVAPTTSDLNEMVNKGLLMFHDLKNDKELRQAFGDALESFGVSKDNMTPDWMDTKVYLASPRGIELVEQSYL
ncbi:hypothetical protein [Vibrio campbellii]|uniref:hypothetical protein n=1 Tax=Vibrio campbellii TaxID=680 RepID=UPI00210BC29F|nr:hypothetical protein [Vibrio campbellii]UTZ44567.1 hypothetical protein HB764_25235 [Vibrio campbellii]